jgi:hypothetical protein
MSRTAVTGVAKVMPRQSRASRGAASERQALVRGADLAGTFVFAAQETLAAIAGRLALFGDLVTLPSTGTRSFPVRGSRALSIARARAHALRRGIVETSAAGF